MTAAQREDILADIYIELDDIRNTMLVQDGRSKVGCIDVRLQLISPDDYSVKCGDASYDTNHHGYWGASSVSADDSDSDLEATAEDLLEQALDDAAESEVFFIDCEVVVGNIGKAYAGGTRTLADDAFETYMEQSKSNVGRAAGEDVTMLVDGEVVREHIGSLASTLPPSFIDNDHDGMA